MAYLAQAAAGIVAPLRRHRDQERPGRAGLGKVDREADEAGHVGVGNPRGAGEVIEHAAEPVGLVGDGKAVRLDAETGSGVLVSGEALGVTCACCESRIKRQMHTCG